MTYSEGIAGNYNANIGTVHLIIYYMLNYHKTGLQNSLQAFIEKPDCICRQLNNTIWLKRMRF